MKTLAGTVLLALGVAGGSAGLAGCKATPLGERFDAVGKEISAARAAGAPKYAPVDYAGARSALDMARDAEDDALDARADCEAAREVARHDLRWIHQEIGAREEALGEAEKRRAGADAILNQLRRREMQLREKGVSEREIERALGDQVALSQLECSASRASIKTVKAEIELLGVRKLEAQSRIEGATEGIAAAGQQLLHANALCDTAGAAARQAEAHAIARRKAELQVR